MRRCQSFVGTWLSADVTNLNWGSRRKFIEPTFELAREDASEVVMNMRKS